MIPENVEEELLAESRLAGACAPATDARASASTVGESLVAFKFGGTSLLGAERMLHAAGLVRPAAQLMQVVVVVSAMKGVTDRLLGIAQALDERKNQRARLEVEALLRLHLDVLRDLTLDSDEHDRVARELNSLGRDLLHEVSARRNGVSAAAAAEVFDRLTSFGERLQHRFARSPRTQDTTAPWLPAIFCAKEIRRWASMPRPTNTRISSNPA